MAAAYAALVSLLNTLVDMQNHPRHSFSFDNNQIQSLLKSVTFLIEFMESFDHCSSSPSKYAAQLLEMRITCAAQAAEQVIDSHIVDQIRGGSTLDGKKRSPRFLLDVEKVNRGMDYVMRKAIKIQQDSKHPTPSAPASSSTKKITSEKTTMVGFDDLLLQLLDVLTGHHSSRRVIPIVGTGGVGKTTLAKNAFDHKLIVQHFDVCLWATISQQYDVHDILLTLLSPQERSSSETVGDLGVKLHKKLYGRRYLIVIDDMWSVTAWDEMKSWFPDTSNRSRIIVTTRQSDVADYIGSSRLAVSLLDDDKSWDLFCQKTFIGEGCPSELEDVGKKIVRKCKGLPLAIVVVAGHLGKSSQSRESWENVANNMMSILNSVENNELFKILSFSYSYLPIHLKPCFVYMGMFPEDKQIRVPDLINRWIAEGFLKQGKSNNLEEIAYDYLKELIDRNLILENTRKNYKNYRGYAYCKIHDLLRELCIKVAKKEMFFYMADTGRAIFRGRQLGIIHNNREKNQHSKLSYAVPPPVRSLNWKTGEQSFNLRLCRVLKYEEVFTDEVDGGFLEADHQDVNLRYLICHRDHRSYVNIDVSTCLPSSISLFWNLQTLKFFEEFSGSVIAPNEIWEMTQLRHLEIGNGIHLPDPPPSDKLEEGNDLVMRNLRTLMVVENFKLSEEVCKRVSNVKELELRYCSDDARSYYCPQNLGCLRKLERLRFDIVQRRGNHNSTCREFALALTFPSSLKMMYLRNTFLDWEEITMMVGSLQCLETLYLENVLGSEWTLVERKFLRLKSLTISFCDLVTWNVDSSHFPVLENLVLASLSKLNELPSDLGAIPTLCSISMNWCNVSLAISATRMLVEQEEEGNEDLRLDILYWNDGELESFNKMVEEECLTYNNLRVRQL